MLERWATCVGLTRKWLRNIETLHSPARPGRAAENSHAGSRPSLDPAKNSTISGFDPRRLERAGQVRMDPVSRRLRRPPKTTSSAWKMVSSGGPGRRLSSRLRHPQSVGQRSRYRARPGHSASRNPDAPATFLESRRGDPCGRAEESRGSLEADTQNLQSAGLRSVSFGSCRRSPCTDPLRTFIVARNLHRPIGSTRR
jgi:hypothetical protein